MKIFALISGLGIIQALINVNMNLIPQPSGSPEKLIQSITIEESFEVNERWECSRCGHENGDWTSICGKCGRSKGW